MSSSFTTTQSQRHDSGASSNHATQSLTSSSGRVLPGAKTSGQSGKGANSSSTTFPPDSSANANSPQPSQANSASSTASQRGSSSQNVSAPPNDSNVTAGSATSLTRQDVGRWSHAVQGTDMPEEVKAIVRTGTHTWSRGIAQKNTASVARG